MFTANQQSHLGLIAVNNNTLEIKKLVQFSNSEHR